MVLKKPIRIDTDLQIAGAVTWVGRSSMEIQLEVTQSTEGTCNLIILFLMFFSFHYFLNIGFDLPSHVNSIIFFT